MTKLLRNATIARFATLIVLAYGAALSVQMAANLAAL